MHQRHGMNPGAVLLVHIHEETDTGRSQFHGLHTHSEIMYNINNDNSNKDC